jgi:hypothetical protein
MSRPVDTVFAAIAHQVFGGIGLARRNLGGRGLRECARYNAARSAVHEITSTDWTAYLRRLVTCAEGILRFCTPTTVVMPTDTVAHNLEVLVQASGRFLPQLHWVQAEVGIAVQAEVGIAVPTRLAKHGCAWSGLSDAVRSVSVEAHERFQPNRRPRMSKPVTCAACVALNSVSRERPSSTEVHGVPLCKEHLEEATRDEKSPAGKFLRKMRGAA